jgi:IPT/TIG domain-containing protein
MEFLAAMRARVRGAVLPTVASLVMFGLFAQVASALPPEVTVSFTGGEQSYTVPAAVTALQIEATGYGPPAGGPGLDLSVGMPVAPDQVLYAEVGGPGGPGGFGGGGAGGVAAGGFNGEAGGGASDVRTCSSLAPSCPGGGTSAASRLVVAGGGGGSGAATGSFGDTCGGSTGGGGAGDYTSPVEAVAGGFAIRGLNDFISSGADQQAEGGTGLGPGVGGVIASCTGGGRMFGSSVGGSSGSGAHGGAGGSSLASPPGGGGGGGGGGYFGGGGGPSGQTEGECPGVCNTSDGSGGAGGSSFYVSGATGFISYARSNLSPSIAFAPLIEISSPIGGTFYRQGQVVNASYACLHSCINATAASGSPIDTSTLGVHSFTVSDQLASHTPAVSTVHYTIVPVSPPPTIKKLSPKSGPVTGGTAVTITGTNFTGTTAVKFGAAGVSNLKVNSATSITADSPAGTKGTVNVTVTTPNGTSANTKKDRFRYKKV